MLLSKRKSRAFAAVRIADFVVELCLRIWPYISASYAAISGEAQKVHHRLQLALGGSTRIGWSALQTFKAGLSEMRRIGASIRQQALRSLKQRNSPA